jgi:hypothetical protein
MNKGWKGLEDHDRKNLNCLAETVSRNMNIQVASGRVSGVNKDHVDGNWPKGDACCKVGKDLVELCCAVL